jgi:hypothetical protein
LSPDPLDIRSFSGIGCVQHAALSARSGLRLR